MRCRAALSTAIYDLILVETSTSRPSFLYRMPMPHNQRRVRRA